MGKEGGGSEGNAGLWRKVPCSRFAKKFDFFPILKGAKWLRWRQRDGTGEQKNPKAYFLMLLEKPLYKRTNQVVSELTNTLNT